MIKWSKVSPLISHCRETPPLLTRAIEYTPSCMTVGWQEKIFLVHGTDFKIFHVIFNWKYCFGLNVMFLLTFDWVYYIKEIMYSWGRPLIKWGSKGGAVWKKSHNKITKCGGGGAILRFYFYLFFVLNLISKTKNLTNTLQPRCTDSCIRDRNLFNDA